MPSRPERKAWLCKALHPFHVQVRRGLRDAYCVGHSNEERATQVGALAAANEARAAAARLEPLLQSPITTQEDVARERLILMRHIARGSKGLTGAAARSLLKGLKDVSAHIERYGTHQGKEGGHSIMRLLPGATIVEANFEYDRVCSKEDLEAIRDGIAQDVRDGIEPALDVAEQAKRYLGWTVRPRDRSRYDVDPGA